MGVEDRAQNRGPVTANRAARQDLIRYRTFVRRAEVRQSRNADAQQVSGETPSVIGRSNEGTRIGASIPSVVDRIVPGSPLQPLPEEPSL